MVTIYGIYAHKNKIDKNIFYVGKQQKIKGEYIRSELFEVARSSEYLEYIKEIGIENIEIIWLYETLDENESLSEKEKIFQEAYYKIYGDKFLCKELISYGDKNPNYGRVWTQEKKDELGRKRRENGKSKGGKNSMAVKCILHFPTGETKNFDTIAETREWFWENITDGIKIELNENIFISKSTRHMPKHRREPYNKSIGYYYTRA